MKLIVGLGNPGLKYKNTRHNCGFWALDEIAKALDFNFNLNTKLNCELANINYNNKTIYFIKPTTFMNLSGDAVVKISNYYKIKVENICIIYDEVDFNPGIIKAKVGGSSAGHNGIKDIMAKVSNNNFIKIRIGIGKNEKQDLISYVLTNPSKQEISLINESISKLVNNLDYLLNSDIINLQQHLNKN